MDLVSRILGLLLLPSGRVMFSKAEDRLRLQWARRLVVFIAAAREAVGKGLSPSATAANEGLEPGGKRICLRP